MTIMRPHEEDPSWLTLTRPFEEPAAEAPQSPGSQDYLIPLPSSCSLGTVRSELNSTPSLDSAPDCCQMQRLLEEARGTNDEDDDDDALPPQDWETSFTNAPIEKPPLPVLPCTPLLISPEDSPTPTLHESRERLMRPGERPSSVSSSPLQQKHHVAQSQPDPPSPLQSQLSTLQRTPSQRSSPQQPSQLSPQQHSSSSPQQESTAMIPLQSLSSSNGGGAKQRSGHHYHPHRYNNSGSSNNSSSSGASSTTGSSISGGGGCSGGSNASTLPLDPGALPCIAPIPPPLQYVNVDVKKRSPEFNEAYVIHETREHREISC